MSEQRAAIVLAAGKGKRMKSDLPKVLHRIGDKPIIRILLDTLKVSGFDRIVVVIGFEGEQIKQELAGDSVSFVWQREQNGTGHAVMMAREELADFDGITLVAAGDVPFLSRQAIASLLAEHQQTAAAATCLSAILDDPTGYGRVVREGSSSVLKEIIEHKDASEEIRKIAEINTGTFCFDNKSLFSSLDSISNDNAQGEYYLTDTVKVLHDRGLRVSVIAAENPDEVRGVNSIEQLAELEALFADRL